MPDASALAAFTTASESHVSDAPLGPNRLVGGQDIVFVDQFGQRSGEVTVGPGTTELTVEMRIPADALSALIGPGNEGSFDIKAPITVEPKGFGGGVSKFNNV